MWRIFYLDGGCCCSEVSTSPHQIISNQHLESFSIWNVHNTSSKCSKTIIISLYVYRNSINSQKFSDERHGPFKPHNVYQSEMRVRPNFRPNPAISALAGSEAGDAASFRAMRYYQGESAKRRDEILTELAKSGTN